MTYAFVGAAAIAGASAAAPPTLDVSPAVVTIGSQVSVLGAAPGASQGERVVVEMKRCAESSWSLVTAVGAEAIAGGRWAAALQPTLNGLVRARLRGVTSAAVRVRVRPYVNLDILARPIFRVEVGVGRYIPGKRVYLERFAGGRWKRVASTQLERDHASFYAISSGRFRYRAPAGTSVRAVVPGASCFLRGVSRIQRTD